MNVEVIYEDKDMVVVNKPAGLLVHGIYDKYGPKHNEETLADWIIRNYPELKEVGDKPEERPGIVHRLDRETSGVIVVARNQETFERLKSLFKNREVKKVYLALVWGKIKEDGIINKPISIKDGTVKRTVFKGKMPREAVTEYKVLKHYLHNKEELTLLEVFPKTGRTHQIRVHLSSIGHSIVGDKLYGKKGTILDLDRHFLHAKKLTIDNREFESKLPAKLERILNNLTV